MEGYAEKPIVYVGNICKKNDYVMYVEKYHKQISLKIEFRLFLLLWEFVGVTFDTGI